MYTILTAFPNDATNGPGSPSGPRPHMGDSVPASQLKSSSLAGLGVTPGGAPEPPSQAQEQHGGRARWQGTRHTVRSPPQRPLPAGRSSHRDPRRPLMGRQRHPH